MSIGKAFLLASLLGLSTIPVQAGGEVQISRSAGKTAADKTIELKSVIGERQLVLSPIPESSQTRDLNSIQGLANRTGQANRYDQIFFLADADVFLELDLDGDGYHHAFNLIFDVDTNRGDASIYAKLYLSREGGPWRFYHTTDLFEIYADDYEDAYEVATELLEGYLPGYYDILIEVFSLDHADLVASQVLDRHYLGRDVTLESLDWDRPDDYYYYYYEEEEVYYSHGGGSFSLLFLLPILLVVIAARGASTITP